MKLLFIVSMVSLTGFLTPGLTDELDQDTKSELKNCYKSYLLNHKLINETTKTCVTALQTSLGLAVQYLPLQRQSWIHVIDSMHQVTFCFVELFKYQCAYIASDLDAELLDQVVKEVHCSQLSKSMFTDMLDGICYRDAAINNKAVSIKSIVCRLDHAAEEQEEVEKCADYYSKTVASPKDESAREIKKFIIKLYNTIQEYPCGSSNLDNYPCLGLKTIRDQCSSQLAKDYLLANQCMTKKCGSKNPKCRGGSGTNTKATDNSPFYRFPKFPELKFNDEGDDEEEEEPDYDPDEIIEVDASGRFVQQPPKNANRPQQIPDGDYDPFSQKSRAAADLTAKIGTLLMSWIGAFFWNRM